jgi:hypothetical protein
VGRVSSPAGRRATALVTRAQDKHRRVAHAIRYQGPYDFIWRNVGPWYAARKLELAGTFHALDLEDVDCAILPDEFMTPLVVRALRVNPDLDVRTRWTRRAIARIYADKVLMTGTEAPSDVEEELAARGEVDAADVGPSAEDQALVEDEAVHGPEDNIRS